MLVFPLGSTTISTTLSATTSSTVTTTFLFGDRTLEYRFDWFCAYLAHDEGEQDFDGGLLMLGDAFVYGTMNGTSTQGSFGSLPFDLSVINATFDPVASTGSCQFTRTYASDPPLHALVSSDPYTSFNVLIDWESFGLDGANGITGLASGTLTLFNAGSSVVTAGPRSFSINRDEPCGYTPGSILTTVS